MSEISRITLGGETRDIADAAARRMASRIYEGAGLAAVHAAEIAAAPFNGDVWAWVRARIQAGNFAGVNVGDWIQFTAGGNEIISEVAGINTYRRSGNPEIANNHIDFISRDCWPEARQWNMANYNNGIAGQNVPWLVSDLYAWLNGLAMDVPNGTEADPETIAVDYTEGSATPGLWHLLPAELRAVIVQKHTAISVRYSAGILLTDCTGQSRQNIGNLWLPSEVEVHGGVVFGTPGFSHAGGVQYPLFANNLTKRVKGDGNGGNHAAWWLYVPTAGSSTLVAIVFADGSVDRALTINALHVPICFRIA